jgi:hypothetical protein
MVDKGTSILGTRIVASLERERIKPTYVRPNHSTPGPETDSTVTMAIFHPRNQEIHSQRDYIVTTSRVVSAVLPCVHWSASSSTEAYLS